GINFRLYLITDRHRTKNDLFNAVEEAMKEGLKAVQLREKDLPVRERLRWAYRMKEIVDRYSGMLFVNDRVDIAVSVGAQGVHLTKDSLPVAVVRRHWPGLLVGYSAHSLDEALQAEAEGAHFVTFSPVFETSSKPDLKPQGLEKLKELCTALKIPVFALGGITPDNAGDVINSGAHGIAVVSAILGSANVREATKSFERFLP
ncbi:MAG: thiamine phosphate synthase, partial [Nitrospirae bacterium]